MPTLVVVTGLATRWVRETAQRQRRTVLLVTHQDEDADAVADERLNLD